MPHYVIHIIHESCAIFDRETGRYLNLQTGEFDSKYTKVEHLFLYQIHAQLWLTASQEDRKRMLKYLKSHNFKPNV